MNDSERDHSMGSPMDRTPHAVISLTFLHGHNVDFAVVICAGELISSMHLCIACMLVLLLAETYSYYMNLIHYEGKLSCGFHSCILHVGKSICYCNKTAQITPPKAATDNLVTCCVVETNSPNVDRRNATTTSTVQNNITTHWQGMTRATDHTITENPFTTAADAGSANGVPLMRETSAVPKKIAAGQHRVKSTGYHLLNESMQYAVSVHLA